ncbi:MAG: hypothetical protein RSA41_05505 [Christensenella sp.]
MAIEVAFMDKAEKKKSDKKFWIILVVIIAVLICMRVFVPDRIVGHAVFVIYPFDRLRGLAGG